ncbi:energy transducer TonB family protein [Bdellovibrio bacteriovorus]|uniref:energy transducer TonB family protein n=1 Tax=Bdellovibrio bacteriovorus TaxID=959 RepID=UPI003D045D1B
MHSSRWILTSVAIHALALSALWLGKPAAIEVPHSPDPIPVEFAVVEKSHAPSAGPKRGILSGASQAMGAKPGTITKSLFKTYDFNDSEDVTENSDGPARDFRDRATYALESANVFADTDNWDYHREVFRRIDSELMFDSILAQYNHFGTVMLQFEVDEKGYLLEKSLRASSEDPILKVHAVRAVRKALTEKFQELKWSSENTIFQAKFEFLSDSPSLNFRKQREFGKPVLNFTRATKEKPVATNLQDHLLNGGIDYDAFAMVERWQKYNKKKRLDVGEYDPFAHYRKDPAYLL